MIENGPYLLAIDAGTEAVKVGLFDASGHCFAFSSRTYRTEFPQPGWAQQDPYEWWTALVTAVHDCMSNGDHLANNIAAICADATTSTLVPMHEDGSTLGPAILWMDVRAAKQAVQINRTEHDALRYCPSGVNAEWMPPKALWLKSELPQLYESAGYLLEYTDWIAYRLTRRYSLNINTITQRWFYDASRDGWPVDFYEAIGLGDVVDKFPSRICRVGEVIGRLTIEAARSLDLPEGIPVCAGGGDAFIGLLGQGVVKPGDLGLITGSSNVLSGLAEQEMHTSGVFGSFPDSLIPGLHLVEAGQTSTGSVLSWFRRNFAIDLEAEAQEQGVSPYALLDREASQAPIGADGLIALDYFQGNRTPHTDAQARGAIWGLSLQSSRGHVFRALLESIAYGLRVIVERLQQSGFSPNEIVVSGGATHSDVFMQIYADVIGLPLRTTVESEASLLGSAVAASVGAELHPDLTAASRQMVAYDALYLPDMANHETYETYYQLYCHTYPALKELMHDMSAYQQQKPAAARA